MRFISEALSVNKKKAIRSGNRKKTLDTRSKTRELVPQTCEPSSRQRRTVSPDVKPPAGQAVPPGINTRDSVKPRLDTPVQTDAGSGPRTRNQQRVRDRDLARLKSREPAHPPSPADVKPEVPGIGGESRDKASQRVPATDSPPSFDDEASCKADLEGWAHKDWASLQRADPVLCRVLKYKCLYGRPPTKEERSRESRETCLLLDSWPLLQVRNRVLMHCAPPPQPRKPCDAHLERVVVPQEQRVELARLAHRAAAHLSYRRIYPLLKERYWWNSMGSDLRAWIWCCELC